MLTSLSLFNIWWSLPVVDNRLPLTLSGLLIQKVRLIHRCMYRPFIFCINKSAPFLTGRELPVLFIIGVVTTCPCWLKY